MSDDTKRTPEELDALRARYERAARSLDTVLTAINTLDVASQNAITDTALRLLRIAEKAGEHGPFALLLASAQLTLDLTPSPEAEPAEDKPEPSRILLLH